MPSPPHRECRKSRADGAQLPREFGTRYGRPMQFDASTSVGVGRLTVATATDPAAVLWLGHGAGGGINALDLTALATALPPLGITVIRYEQPWRAAGRRVAPRPATLDIAWRETAPAIAELAQGIPVVVGGRSAGARVACRTAADTQAAAVVCLAFPLHPPGSPEKSRIEELLSPTIPVLVLQGDRDLFGSPLKLSAETTAHRNIRVVPVPGADHGMKALKSGPLNPHGIIDLITGTVAEFVRSVI